MNRPVVLIRRSALSCLLALAPALVSTVEAREPQAPNTGAVAATALTLSETPPPLSARYRVTVTTPARSARPPVKQIWHFHRNAEQVALLKGTIDEVWHRDRQGLVSFERVFHDDQRTVDYTVGELATIGVATDWAALSSLVDAQVLRSLRVVSRRGTGAAERVVLVGRAGSDAYRVEWSPALQLPTRMQRTERNGRQTELVLEQQVAVAPATWPVVGQRSADYLRLDAADFGDMDYDAVVRKSEALDIRLGWRTAHHHD